MSDEIQPPRPEVKKLPRSVCGRCGLEGPKPMVEKGRCVNTAACELRFNRQVRRNSYGVDDEQDVDPDDDTGEAGVIEDTCEFCGDYESECICDEVDWDDDDEDVCPHGRGDHEYCGECVREAGGEDDDA